VIRTELHRQMETLRISAIRRRRIGNQIQEIRSRRSLNWRGQRHRVRGSRYADVTPLFCRPTKKAHTPTTTTAASATESPTIWAFVDYDRREIVGANSFFGDKTNGVPRIY